MMSVEYDYSEETLGERLKRIFTGHLTAKHFKLSNSEERKKRQKERVKEKMIEDFKRARKIHRSKTLYHSLGGIEVGEYKGSNSGKTHVFRSTPRSVPFSEFDPALDFDVEGYMQMTPEQRKTYETNLMRLREIAHIASMQVQENEGSVAIISMVIPDGMLAPAEGTEEFILEPNAKGVPKFRPVANVEIGFRKGTLYKSPDGAWVVIDEYGMAFTSGSHGSPLPEDLRFINEKLYRKPQFSLQNLPKYGDVFEENQWGKTADEILEECARDPNYLEVTNNEK